MKTKKILVIDDQPGNVILLQDRLIREGFHVLTAYDGMSGIDRAKTEQPDLIILDVMMPGIDGFETSRQLSSSKETSHIPIIMVTALNSSEDTQRGFDCGATDYIKKPFNKIELLSRVKAALRSSETNKLLVELEKVETYSAIVKKTNHDIKQPLTLINLSITALKRELANSKDKNEIALKRIGFIEEAVKNILKIMKELTSKDNFEIKEYLTNLKNDEFKIGSELESL